MQEVSIITHNNCRIVLFNAANLKENEICEGIVELTDIGIVNRINCFIIDATGTHTTPRVKDMASANMKRASEKMGKIYSAIIGLSPLQRIIANAISRDQYFASSVDDAKTWLAARFAKTA